ncbi:MAG TPA: helix-turn-helix transcriptional regulator [Isosphaeraceae bacterium]|nr:helix-turn-helix transcriptional regulator [Isosphaeraceae bacterium]
MTLAKRIRDCRYAKGWGPDELAGRAQISRTALYQIESGKTETPRAGTLRRIAKALGVTTDALLGNEMIRNGVADRDAESLREAPGSDLAATPEGVGSTPILASWPNYSQTVDLDRKFRELLESPLGESVARIIEESHRLLPAIRQTRGRA